MIFGSADSDEEVPRTIRISSLMYFRKREDAEADGAAMPPRMTKTNSRAGDVHPRHQLSQRMSEPTP
jgi:hypothetical protein